MDPAKFLDRDSGEKKYVSMWRSEFWSEFKSLFGMFVVDYEQGALGHPTIKPTTNGTNYLALESLRGLKADRAKMRTASSMPSASLARWAPGLRRRLVEAVLGPQWQVCGNKENSQLMAKKLTKEQSELWRKHLESDHIPYRADCAVCVEAQASGRPQSEVSMANGWIPASGFGWAL